MFSLQHQVQQQPLAELGMDALLVGQAGVCAGLGLGEQALSRLLREMGLFSSSGDNVLVQTHFECLPPRAQCGELGGKVLLVPEQGSWKGELCSNFLIYLIFPCPKGKRELLCAC